MAALSVAVDLGLGETVEHAQRSAVISVALSEAAGLTEEQAQDAYYLSLLQTVGCTGDHDFAFQNFGEDMAEWIPLAVMGAPMEMMGSLVRNVGRGQARLKRARSLARAFGALPGVMRNTQIHCEVGTMLSERLGLGPRVVAGLGQVFERWDGQGAPHRLRGDALALPVRVSQLARDIELGTRKLGLEGAVGLMRRRAGKGHDPRLVERFVKAPAAMVAGLDTGSTWKAVLDAEPGARPRLCGERLDQALRSVGEFADMKSSFTRGHSAGVADLARAAAAKLGLGAADQRAAAHAGHLHDVGRVAVYAYVWDKAGPLSDAEWERVRLHSYYTERVLCRLEVLGTATAIASLAHERRDGSGYHRRLSSGSVPALARVLAAADVYQALTSVRPHRAAMPADAAAAELRKEVAAGRLDGEAAEAVLAGAGHAARRPTALPANLTAREAEVLRLMARGLTNKEIAGALDISTKTAGHHVEHIFTKIRVTTRAAAALYAMQNDLLVG